MISVGVIAQENDTLGNDSFETELKDENTTEKNNVSISPTEKTTEKPKVRSLAPTIPKSIANSDEKSSSKSIDLRTLIEEGFRKNALEKIRTQEKELIEIDKTDNWQSFWTPKLAFEINTENQRFDRLKTSSSSTAQMGAQQAPTGSFGFAFDNFKIFNWGRDYLQYKVNKNTFKRRDQELSEARRLLKFNIISFYFNLVRLKQIEKFKLDQLKQSSFLNRLAREKLELKKIRAQEYYQTRSEFLRSQTEYQEAQYVVALEEERLSNLLADNFHLNYRTNEQLKYLSLNMTQSEALKLTLTQSPQFREALVRYENSSMLYDKALKDNLPLPELSLNLGAYKTGFDPDGKTWNYQTSPGNKNVELVAGINMKWTIWGDGGFLNSRDNQRAFLAKKIAEITFYDVKRELEVKIKTIFKTIKFLEQKVLISESQFKTAQNNYDSTLNNYIAGRATYPDIKLSLDNLVLSSINYENVKYDHLLKKLELADFMGLEDFPGENFEQLAVR